MEARRIDGTTVSTVGTGASTLDEKDIPETFNVYYK